MASVISRLYKVLEELEDGDSEGDYMRAVISESLRLRPVGGGLESIKEDRVASPRLSHWALCAERCEDLDKTAALLHKIGANTLKRGGPRLPARLLSSLFCRSQRNEVRVPVRPGDASLEKSH